MAVALCLVVVIASLLAVLGASGSFAASPPATFTVTCGLDGFINNKATFSWSGANGIGSIDILSTGSNHVRLTTSQRSGTFEVIALVAGPSVDASAEMWSTPDKSGNVTRLATAFTPAGGC